MVRDMSVQNFEVRIGIDAKWYFEGPASGKMVIRNLVNEICKLKSKFKFYIILDKKYKGLKLDFENTKVEKVYVWNGNNLLSNVFCIPHIAKKYSLDVVLYQTSVSCFGKHKKIAYIHDLIYISHPQYYTLTERVYLKPLKFLTRFSDFVITVSNSEKKRITDLNFTDKNVLVLHHGYDPVFNKLNTIKRDSFESLKVKYNLYGEYILYVGRINTRKNIPNLLKALQSIEDKKIKLVMVGKSDWKKDNIQALIKQKNLSNRIIQTGSVSNEELALIYSNASIFCFPSFEEAFGLPPLEAMASGIPVVVSNSSSLPEVCGEAAIYFNANEPKEIAAALSKLLFDKALYNKQKQLSLDRAKLFSWTKTTQNLIEILEERYI
jgi:glycosyltransferase involved in cell wall biosynthesis